MTVLALVLLSAAAPQLAATRDEAPRPVEVLRSEAERVLGLVQSRSARLFLEATRALPSIQERVVYQDSRRSVLTPEEHARLAAEEQAQWTARPLGEEFYYLTKYGSPIAYARLVDLLGSASVSPGGEPLLGKRLLDFGYGGIGHLRLLASLGNDAVGVDVDPLLDAFYRPEDEGEIPAAAPGGKAGRLRLVHGSWPSDEAVRAAVGGGYDLILSKNTLKRGYITPAKPVDPRMLVQLGVTPEGFLRAVADALNPGGLFAIYNLCPAQKPEYVPWADGVSPFTREQLDGAGFELLAFDVDDRDAAKELAWALKWDEQGMDVEGDLFAWYTLARKRRG